MPETSADRVGSALRRENLTVLRRLGEGDAAQPWWCAAAWAPSASECTAACRLV